MKRQGVSMIQDDGIYKCVFEPRGCCGNYLSLVYAYCKDFLFMCSPVPQLKMNSVITRLR